MVSYTIHKIRNFKYYIKSLRSWYKLSKKLRKEHPYCSICGSTKRLDVHHKIPRHVNPNLILVPENCVVLCRECHFRFGHLLDWRKWNMDIDTTITRVRYEINKGLMLYEKLKDTYKD